jgi:ubiquinone/menaquinone biosynthesis C-methylase UbiE
VATNAAVRWPRTWTIFRPLIRLQFDRLAPVWDRMRLEDTFAPYQAALDRVEGPIGRALDVGTGTGAGARILRERFPGVEVTGVDLAPGMLEEARRLVPGASFVQADAAALPFDGGSFDLVTQNNMIPFVDELARVVKPGGWVVLSFSSGPETPIWVKPSVLRTELESRGFTDFAEIAAGRGVAVLVRRDKPH